ncbi:MAG: FAD:protein FMN transferase [Micrococcales bacterium]|nr:FAD:protein FMN transferase [Micrococcales bacterium]
MNQVKEFRHTEFCMGTVFRFVGRTELNTDKAIAEAVAVLHEADSIFSLYKPDSPLSKLARGETSVAQCPAVVNEIWDLCEKWTKETEGWFTAFTPEHTFDPSGVVKTWAAKLAAEKLEENGITDFAMNAGGDIRLSKEITPGFALRIGISTPVTIASPEAGVLTVVDLNDSNFRAVATSGTAERGEHIWNPKNKSWANQLAQVTVVSDDLVSADVWATALFAAGDQGLALAEKHGLQALFVNLEGQLFSTKSFTELLHPV